MSAKKWLIILALSIVLALAVVAGFNIAVDPFGAFGDSLMDWYSYDMTNNPRIAKIAYLEKHGEEYDSFIIGSSSAAAYSPEVLNDYTGGKFFNLFVYGCNTADYRLYADYVVKNCHAKNIILNLGINETNEWDPDPDSRMHSNHAAVTGENKFLFYLRQAFCNPKYSFEKLSCRREDTYLPQRFDTFLTETGCYDKRVRDVEKIGDPEAYMNAHGDDFGPQESAMEYWPECVETVRYIRDLCRENGVEFTVVCSPAYESQWASCPPEKMQAYKTALAEVTDYWDFSHSSLSYDSRYFYDGTHSRNALGQMMTDRIFGREDRWIPEDFGVYVTEENAGSCVEQLYAARPSREKTCVPVLMYHHFVPDGSSEEVLSASDFRRQMTLLKEAGYHTVTVQQMLDYVRLGRPLPEKPICVTMDDGYLSNYEIAFPVLRDLGMCGTVFAIDVSVGKTMYKDTEYEMTPHFSWEQANEMQESGVMDIQSHTYDMHQWQPFEAQDPCRRSVAKLPGESDEDFIAVLSEDLERTKVDFSEHSLTDLCALAYPNGDYSVLSEVILHESGIPVTFGISSDTRNVLVRGLPQSLYGLCRLNISYGMTDEEFLFLIEQQEFQ